MSQIISTNHPHPKVMSQPTISDLFPKITPVPTVSPVPIIQPHPFSTQKLHVANVSTKKPLSKSPVPTVPSPNYPSKSKHKQMLPLDFYQMNTHNTYYQCALYKEKLMARLNITIPDTLYERLEQARDRLNISKTCANALEKELTMLGGRRPITDPRIAQLLQRLQGTRERWYQRGHEDATQWAVETATRGELSRIATEMADWDGTRLFSEFRDEQRRFPKLSPPMFPSSFHFAEHFDAWVADDMKSGDVLMGEEAERINQARTDVDEASYLEGWRDSIKEIWQTISPALQ